MKHVVQHTLVLSTWLLVIFSMPVLVYYFDGSLDIKIFGYLVSLFLFVNLPPVFYLLYLIYDCFKTGKVLNWSNGFNSATWVYRSEKPAGFRFCMIYWTVFVCGIIGLVLYGCILKLD